MSKKRINKSSGNVTKRKMASRNPKKSVKTAQLDIDDLISAFTIAMQEGELRDAVSDIVEQAITGHETRIVELESKTSEHSEKINGAMITLDMQEQYSRQNNIRIFNDWKEDTQESTEDLFKKVQDLATKCGVTLNENDIDCVHRVGRRIAYKTRTVIVKFVRRMKKM